MIFRQLFLSIFQLSPPLQGQVLWHLLERLSPSCLPHNFCDVESKVSENLVVESCIMEKQINLYHSSHIVQRHRLQCISQSCKLSHTLDGKTSHTPLSRPYTPLLWCKPSIPLPLVGLDVHVLCSLSRSMHYFLIMLQAHCQVVAKIYRQLYSRYSMPSRSISCFYPVFVCIEDSLKFKTQTHAKENLSTMQCC